MQALLHIARKNGVHTYTNLFYHTRVGIFKRIAKKFDRNPKFFISGKRAAEDAKMPKFRAFFIEKPPQRKILSKSLDTRSPAPPRLKEGDLRALLLS